MERPFAAYQGKEPYVFVSYAHEDSDAIFSEILWLNDQGFNVWFDEGISPGSRWSDELADALKDSALFLYFASPQSVNSQHCQDEINLALDAGKHTIAVHIQETELTSGLQLRLSSHQAILKHELSDQEYRDKLIAGISSHVKPGGAGPQPTPLPNVRNNNNKPILVGFGLVAAAILIVGALMFSRSAPVPIPERSTSTAVQVQPLDAGALNATSGAVDFASNYSIAVLPFLNLSNDDETGFFARGLSEDILDNLANRVFWDTQLNIASRTASFQLAEKAEDPATIAAKLEVAYVLEGSVRQVGDGLRITAQLIRAADGFHVWSKSYESRSSDSFKAQAGVVQSIAGIVANELMLDAERQHASEYFMTRGIDPIAAQHFFDARHQYLLIHLGEGGDWALYEQLLKKAVEADPNFYWAYLFQVRVYVERFGGRLPLQEALPLAHAALGKMVALHPYSSSTLLQLGQIRLFLDLDYAEAEAAFKQGLKQDPKVIWFHNGLAFIAECEGRINEALQRMATASVLDVGAEQATFLNRYALTLLIAEEYEQSLKISAEALNLALGGAQRAMVLHTRASTLIEAGRAEEARPLLAEAWGLDGHVRPENYSHLFAVTGERERAVKILAGSALDVKGAYYTARAYLALGDIDATFKAIDSGIRNHSPGLIWTLPTAKMWDIIRDDPRFNEMLELLDSRVTHTERYLRDHNIEKGDQ